ncbi:hypothetical protein P2Q00_42070 [Streptomyces coacervatus]|uniref:hypothetical protein n=1 Tax=Streptomyces coacervatus TaxID=647381 RepID=UPI0023DA5FC3|nr:hypothetical protein [Streptomyces coacervatus]MDF2271957.1 hypothetical protein [Streptomyces coacervatus]
MPVPSSGRGAETASRHAVIIESALDCDHEGSTQCPHHHQMVAARIGVEAPARIRI